MEALQRGLSRDLGLINWMHEDVSRDAFLCFVTPSSCGEIISLVIRTASDDSTAARSQTRFPQVAEPEIFGCGVPLCAESNKMRPEK